MEALFVNVVLVAGVVFAIGMAVWRRVRSGSPASSPVAGVMASGRLPPAESTVSDEGRRLLTRAMVLIAQAVEAGGQLQEGSESVARELLDQADDRRVRAAVLLERVGLLLHQVEAEDNVVDLLPSDRKRAVSVWLDRYLHREKG